MLLAGGGHSHALLLKRWAMHPHRHATVLVLAGLTCISSPSWLTTTPLWLLLTDRSPAPMAHGLLRLIVAAYTQLTVGVACTQPVPTARAQPSWSIRPQLHKTPLHDSHAQGVPVVFVW